MADSGPLIIASVHRHLFQDVYAGLVVIAPSAPQRAATGSAFRRILSEKWTSYSVA